LAGSVTRSRRGTATVRHAPSKAIGSAATGLLLGSALLAGPQNGQTDCLGGSGIRFTEHFGRVLPPFVLRPRTVAGVNRHCTVAVKGYIHASSAYLLICTDHAYSPSYYRSSSFSTRRQTLSGCQCLEASHGSQDDHNEQKQCKPAARVIAPVPAVRPPGQRPQNHENQDHDQDIPHVSSPFGIC
jgi:hypothetical protein